MNANKSHLVDYNIVDGPSGNALIDALKYAYGGSSMTVEFSLKKGIQASVLRYKARIVGVSHEDGSGASFGIELYLLSDNMHYSGYYHSERKIGYLRIS